MKLGSSLHRGQHLSGKRPKSQREVAKWQDLRALALALPMLLACCAPDAAPPAGPFAGWNGDESPQYRAGHGDGSRDRRSGKPAQPDARKPAAGGESYLQGYRAGFAKPHDNPWSRQRACELGELRGREDRRAGRPMDPDGSAAMVPDPVRGDFREAYREAWN
jgi:hypothetical protein